MCSIACWKTGACPRVNVLPNVFLKWLWVFRLSLSSEDVRIQLERLHTERRLLQMCAAASIKSLCISFFCDSEALIHLIMSAMSKHVCYPSTWRSPHYTCSEGWCPSHGAHWSHIRQDLGVAYTLWLKLIFSACFGFNETTGPIWTCSTHWKLPLISYCYRNWSNKGGFADCHLQ